MSVNHLLCGCQSKLSTIVRLTLGGTLKNRTVNAFNAAIRTGRNYSSNKKHKLAMHQDKFLKSDNIPSAYSLIYKAPFENYIIAAVTSTTVLTVLSSVSAASYYLVSGRDFNVELTFHGTVVSGSFYEAVAFVSFTLAITLALFIMSRRYVLRVYRGKEDFVAIYAGTFPGITRKLRFKPGTVVHLPSAYRILPWSGNLYKIDGTKSILLEDHFRTYRDLNVMMLGENTFKTEE